MAVVDGACGGGASGTSTAADVVASVVVVVVVVTVAAAVSVLGATTSMACAKGGTILPNGKDDSRPKLLILPHRAKLLANAAAPTHCRSSTRWWWIGESGR